MADSTAIEWTDATWNPIAGCSLVSPGCTNCYAMKMAARIERMGGVPHYAGLTQPSKAGPVWTGKVARAPDHILTQPLRWKKPRRIFVNSMADLFHDDVPDAWIDQVFAVMALAPQHTFQVLTKRAKRMRDYVNRNQRNGCGMDRMLGGEMLGHYNAALRAGVAIPALALPLPNVWLGVSVEDQARADERIPDLLATPAAVRFLSCEPLLGPVDIGAVVRRALLDGAIRNDGKTTPLGWCITGGESGPGARPAHPDWFRSLRDQCAAAGVPFFFKQWGEWRPAYDSEVPERFGEPCRDFRCMCSNGFVGELAIESAFLHKPVRWPQCFPAGADADASCNSVNLRRVGKMAAGALLDGREHREFPA